MCVNMYLDILDIFNKEVSSLLLTTLLHCKFKLLCLYFVSQIFVFEMWLAETAEFKLRCTLHDIFCFSRVLSFCFHFMNQKVGKSPAQSPFIAVFPFP